ncbi:MAG: nucleotidyl transferase AbiEii/AbiGii toxin family protein [Candidatus Calescibacterium sp.]
MQREILTIFSEIHDSKMFYLTGGTALAEFYLGHRKSFDLDIFTTEKGLIIPFSYAFEQELKKNFLVKVVRRYETFVEFEVSAKGDSTKVQLAYDSPFRFENPIDSDIGVKVNDYTDLIVDKLLAFFGRAEPRDTIDLFFILKTEDFWKLIELAKQKDPGFDLYWLAIALHKIKNFPDDLRDWPVDTIKKVDIKELKGLLLNLSREIMDKIKAKSK